jgi:hypothetical protein
MSEFTHIYMIKDNKLSLQLTCQPSFMKQILNGMASMQLIEESNQLDYLLLLLDFHYHFPSQTFLLYHSPLTTLCTRVFFSNQSSEHIIVYRQLLCFSICSIIAFACGWYDMTCSWFVYHAIIILYRHLFELTFEFGCFPIVKDNKLRLRVTTCQPTSETNPRWMLLIYLWLQQFQTSLCFLD